MSAQLTVTASNSGSLRRDELVAEWLRQTALRRPIEGPALGGANARPIPADLWLRVEGL